ncbi:MAG: GNAT family N-acetyltransferase [Gammaproteobacteria bacterium]|nr:GNAT family N-acetyltransferase [Gammaproteobacteria bacterium]
MQQEKYSNSFEKKVRDGVERIIVYEENGLIVGFASGHMQCSIYDSELDGLYVLPLMQRRGIGTSLLYHMKSHFERLNCKNMVAWTLLGATNNAFYEMHGGIAKGFKSYEFASKQYNGVGYMFLV